MPPSATRHYPQWWHGDRPNTRAWRRAGYELDHVQVGRSVRFRRSQVVGSDAVRLQPGEAHAAGRPHGRVHTAASGPLDGLDPRTTLIVLQCSGMKSHGGALGQSTPVPWPDSLHHARVRLGAVPVHDRQLMPAWRRYTGSFYVAAGDAVAAAVAASAQVVILSGGYGIVRADEPIARYNREFRLSDWPPGLLSNLLVEEAARVRAKAVVAFASSTTDYARLVRRTPWHRAGVATALLVTIASVGGGAMVVVPRGLGHAFGAFWQRKPGAYPHNMIVESLL